MLNSDTLLKIQLLQPRKWWGGESNASVILEGGGITVAPVLTKFE